MTKEERKEYNKLWYQKNKEKRDIQLALYRTNNRDKIKEYHAKNKDKRKERELKNIDELKKSRKMYREQTKEKRKEYRKEYNKNNKKKNDDYRYEYIKNRIKNDSLFKLKLNIANLIRQSFRNNNFRKTSKTCEILGCTYQEFKIYLESKFESWMNWDNRGLYNGQFKYGWDVDHIIPLSSAKTVEDIIRLNHYTNLQPLCSKINRDIKKNELPK
jgi:hypothetical protein